ncbi:MAG TPA: CBS domain-containing protein [Desulfobacteraceae bacterium]|jgi:CBS domain-containing protein|nr:CBS domain-containing protein [Desulfobacteraceae bacterium]
MKYPLVKDFMIPVDECPKVKRSASIYEAMQALKAEHEKHPSEKPEFRVILVLDDKDRVVGKVGHIAFLKGLMPKGKDVFDQDKLSRDQLSSSFINLITKDFNLWDENFQLCQIAKNTTISEIMHPTEEHIEADASLAEAIYKILTWQHISLLVTEGRKVVGILRLSDIYAKAEGFILNCD